MRQTNFLFPGYPIIQDDDYFKLSQDSVVLSSFSAARKNDKILDIGCGIGVLTLLMLIRHDTVTAHGLEITKGAAELARENLALNNFETRGTIDNINMSDFPKALYGAFDMCISNPPYFSPNRGFSSPRPEIAAARNESCGDIYDVCLCASRALKWGGRFNVCYPPERLGDLFAALSQNNLEPKIMRLVHADIAHGPNLVLIGARKGGGAGLIINPPLIIRENGAYTDEFQKIYRLEVE